jgi:uncharacterized repeat protein (TIGR03803 family)
VIFDRAGNLYGTTSAGGNTDCRCGTVYQLTPSGNGWAEHVLYSFQGGSDGDGPLGGLIFDQSGNLYGTASEGGSGGGGTVFTMRGGFDVLYSFRENGALGSPGPVSSLTMDAAGNIYGTTEMDGSGYGTVFKLTPSGSGWTYTLLHDFSSGDGHHVMSNVVLDKNGKLYGTARQGGTGGHCMAGCGTVWEITP